MHQENNLPEPGAVIDTYRVGPLLGMGGCAAVYQASEERIGRDVALKVILPSAAESIPGLVDRFQREIDIVKRLEHPNIVRLYNFGQADDGLIWMAMELVRGEELETILKDEGRMEADRAVPIMLQVLSALSAAHKLQIVHRDLKPSNIMLTEQGAEEDVVKLLDFGIGKAIGEGGTSAAKDITAVHGPSTGTPKYLAPELIKEDTLGPYSDVYAMGLVFYEMLTGRPAVSGNSLFEIIAQQVGRPIVLPDWLEHSPLSPVLHKALAKSPSERYPSALEFYRALKRVNYQSITADDAYKAEYDRMRAGQQAAAAGRAMPSGDFSFGSSLSAFIDPNASPDDTIPFTPNFSDLGDPSLPQLPQESSSQFGLPMPSSAAPAPPSPASDPLPEPPSNALDASSPSPPEPPPKPRPPAGPSDRVRQLLIVVIIALSIAIIGIVVAMALR